MDGVKMSTEAATQGKNELNSHDCRALVTFAYFSARFLSNSLPDLTDGPGFKYVSENPRKSAVNYSCPFLPAIQ